MGFYQAIETHRGRGKSTPIFRDVSIS